MSIIPSTSLWKRKVTYLHGIPMDHGKTAPKCVKVHTGIERKRRKLVLVGTIWAYSWVWLPLPGSGILHPVRIHTYTTQTHAAFLNSLLNFLPPHSGSHTCVSTHVKILRNCFFPFFSHSFSHSHRKFLYLGYCFPVKYPPSRPFPPRTFPALCHFECFILSFSFHGLKVRVTERSTEGIGKAGKFTVGKESEKTGVFDSL